MTQRTILFVATLGVAIPLQAGDMFDVQAEFATHTPIVKKATVTQEKKDVQSHEKSPMSSLLSNNLMTIGLKPDNIISITKENRAAINKRYKDYINTRALKNKNEKLSDKKLQELITATGSDLVLVRKSEDAKYNYYFLKERK